MLSKAQIKYIRSLSLQKYRKEHRQFVAEGEKLAAEWLRSNAGVAQIIATEQWVEEHTQLLARNETAALYVVEEHILASISSLKTASKVVLVVQMPDEPVGLPYNEWAIVLDGIQDPGNMGAIIRIADWFGIPNVVCSPDCVDVYNAKVVQAGMGSHLRVRLFETALEDYFQKLTIPLLAAVLNGESIYSMPQFENAVLLIGNEGKGISSHLVESATHKVTIPARGGAESLNAAISTGILAALLVPR